MKFKINPICEICTAWCEIVVVNGQEYLKCRSCGFMRKVSKRDITPVGKSNDEAET